MFKRSGLCGLFVLAAALGGCSRPAIEPISDRRWFELSQRSALNSNQLSEVSQLLLRRRDLVERYRKDPQGVINLLAGELCTEPSRPRVSLVAELCYDQARRNRPESGAAAGYYTAAMVYGYAYLFDAGLGEPPNIYDARFRMCCDLYNRSLARVLEQLQREGRLWAGSGEVRCLLGDVHWKLRDSSLPWPTDQFKQFLVAYRYQPVGLTNHYRRPGLGVPLIGLRPPPLAEHAAPQDAFLPPLGAVYPVTGVAWVNGSLCDAAARDGKLEIELALRDALDESDEPINGHAVPLEIDVTTPLAYLLNRRPPQQGIKALFRTVEFTPQRGLYMLEPCQRGKIPVVFVHGLMSDPTTWVPMLNELLADVELREHFQFWFYFYPSGYPIPYSAALFRDELAEAVKFCDPEQDDPEFRHVVLIGHSMGGVISRLMVQSSGDHLWQAFAGVPFESLELDAGDRELLRKMAFFEPLPFVTRTVFIAAPHRGSKLADINLAQLAAKLISLPLDLTGVVFDATQALIRIAPDSPTVKRIMKASPTSIESLSPESPVATTTDQMRFSPHVTYHSIIGNREEAGRIDGTDGVVPYSSAHLAGAASELVVHATHTQATKVPHAAREVQRILIEHRTAALGAAATR
jgi:pimeloyl-ACP methyl ester carboxylesterase